MKKAFSFPINNFTEFRNKMLNWVQPFNIFCLLDNHQYHFEQPAFECLLAVESKKSIVANAGNAFELLKEFHDNEDDWLFGNLSYDLKNEMEQLTSMNFDGIDFPDCHFFVPEIVLQLNEKQLTIYCEDEAAPIFAAIEATSAVIEQTNASAITIQSRLTPNDYLSIIRKLQQHILRGDCYEINFCQEFYAEQAVIDPLFVYEKLVTLSPNPFSALYKFNDKYCMCASPERYLKRTGSKIYSQPIKGTAKRNIDNLEQDEVSRGNLLISEKDKSENVMVVDLVRNDLSRVCKEGTVKVDELFGIYSFPQVHQMISTISGELKDNIDWTDIIKATFPMGSMTGAPKKRVMELIERYEHTRRGLFSGAIGYIDPKGDFDFNVVIRSVLYNATAKYLSFQAGSAITFYSDPEEEYEECLLKAAAIKQILE
ncbi:MAG: anthranilate synthase component I family protein [Ferruginibacter sp.]